MMTKEKIKTRFTILFTIVLSLFLSRFLPFPPNFTPILAAAMFGGTYFYDKKVAYFIPILVMIASDLIQYRMMGYLYPQTINFVVYGCIIITAFIGTLMRNKSTAVKVVLGSLSSSIAFFVITNFGVWLTATQFYAPTPAGLLACYTAAIPFFHNTLISSLVFSGLLYGGYELASRQFKVLSIEVKA